LKLSAEE
jgi:hypothetical protein